MQYIHYGNSMFSKELFRPVRNRNWIKPLGGLWASPVGNGHDAIFGWKEWCLENDFYTDRLEESFEFELSPNAKKMDIFSKDDLERLQPYAILDPLYAPLRAIDFEKMLADGYSAIEVKMVYPHIYYTLYGWDCDSILVLDPDVVIAN